jgi:hypothetical protein
MASNPSERFFLWAYETHNKKFSAKAYRIGKSLGSPVELIVTDQTTGKSTTTRTTEGQAKAEWKKLHKANLHEAIIRVRRKDFKDKTVRKFISRTLLPQGHSVQLTEVKRLLKALWEDSPEQRDHRKTEDFKFYPVGTRVYDEFGANIKGVVIQQNSTSLIVRWQHGETETYDKAALAHLTRFSNS